MSKKKKSSIPLQSPQYRGGKKAMLEFIRQNLVYPEEALKNRVEGSVNLQYIIDGLGKVIEVEVIRGLGHGCDEEAIRLVKSLVFEKVYNRGLKTRTKRSISIHFKLPKPQPVRLKYNLVPGVKKEKNQNPSGTYQINIKLPKK